MEIENLLASYGLAAIFIVMLVKGIGVPVPIPADLIMLLTAAQVALGKFVLWEAFLVLLAAMVAGGSVQFLLARAFGRRFLYRFGRYLGLTPERLDRVSTTLSRRGAVALGLALVTPGVRTAAVPAAGMAGVPFLTFLSGATLGSVAFLTLHFALGLAGGPLVARLMDAANLPFVLVLVLFFAVGLVGWMALRRRAPGATLERLGDFADAACPACLALGAVEHLRSKSSQV